MAYLLAGPLVALIGIGAVFFVLRRKSVEKRSMYSARRSQIEHKVRAARQRTLTPHGHAEKPAEAAPAGAQRALMDARPKTCRADAAGGARGTDCFGHSRRLLVGRQHDQGWDGRPERVEKEGQGKGYGHFVVAACLWGRPGYGSGRAR